MARLKLTDRSVRAITPPESGQIDYFDERLPGFGLRVSQGGHKSWIVTYRHAGRFRRHTIGPYPRLSLSEARAEAKNGLHAAAQGRDPADEKHAERLAETFGELAHEYLERHAKLHKRSWREDQRILERELLPRWQQVKAKAITRRHVRYILDGIMERGSLPHLDWLRSQGHDAVYLRDKGWQRMPNDQIFEKALSDHRIILTSDLDFGEIAAALKDTVGKVLLLRLHNTRAANVIHRLTSVLARVEDDLAAGAVVIVEEARHRIRQLPIGRTSEPN